MKPQHLSDEAVAAFADGVLRGHARERARRHTAECPECAYAVAVQREAVWALRAAPAPALPTGLLDRLREVPATTPIATPPTAIGPDGSTLMATFGTFAPTGVAAVVDGPHGTAPGSAQRADRSGRLRPVVGAAVAVAAAGVLAVASAAHASGQTGSSPAGGQPSGRIQPAVFTAAVQAHR